MYCYSNLFLLLFTKIILELDPKHNFRTRHNRILSIVGFRILKKVSDSIGFGLGIRHIPNIVPKSSHLFSAVIINIFDANSRSLSCTVQWLLTD